MTNSVDLCFKRIKSVNTLFIWRITPGRLTIDWVDYLLAKWVPLAASDIGRGHPLPAPRPMREAEEFACTFLPMTVTISDKLITSSAQWAWLDKFWKRLLTWVEVDFGYILAFSCQTNRAEWRCWTV